MSIISLCRLGEWVKVFIDTFALSILLWLTTYDDPIGIFNLFVQ